MSPFRFALLRLTRHPLASFISVLSIAISVMVCGVLFRLYLLSESRFQKIIPDYNAVVSAKGSSSEILLQSLNFEGEKFPDFIPEQLYRSLQTQSKVSFEDHSTSSISFFQQLVPVLFCGHYAQFKVLGTENFFFRTMSLSGLQEGRLWSSSDPTSTKVESSTESNVVEAVLGADVAENLHLQVGSQFKVYPWSSGYSTSSNLGSSFNLQVVGVLHRSSLAFDRGIYIPLSQAQSIVLKNLQPKDSIWGAHVLHFLLAKVSPERQEEARHFLHGRTVTQIIYAQEEMTKIQKLLGYSQDLGFLMSVLILLLGVLAVAGVMVSQSESSEEQIAILRALGYSKNYIVQSLMMESLFLGLFSVLLGSLLGAFIFPWLQMYLGSSLSLQTVQESWWARFHIPLSLAALLISQASAWIPIYKVFRMDVHHALRGAS